MPIDINVLRVDRGGNPDKVRESERKRRAPADSVDKVIDLDQAWVKTRYQLDQLNQQFNQLNDEIKKTKPPTEEQKAKSKELKAQIKQMEEREKEMAGLREQALLKIGNVLHESVPDFAREEDGEVCVTSWGDFASPEGVLTHNQALWMIGGFEPDKGNAVAGHRGYYLRGPGVILNQALIRYSLDFLQDQGYEPVQPPYFMNRQAMAKVSQLSDFDESLYHVSMVHRGGEDNEDDDKYLIATSEQPLCCFHMEEMLHPSQLPIKYAGFSSCFRKEAGKFGVDVMGIFRVHQFDKVEQFVVTTPDEAVSYKMLEDMRVNAENFLKSLKLPFKTINVVSGELNLAAAKKYDINAWFPGLKAHKELVSASNCTDYQSRAANTTVQDGEKRKHVHLLNATLCALTRTICCIMENYQGEKEMPDGTKVKGVFVPEVLRPYARNIDFFPFVREPKVWDKQAGANKAEARRKSEAKAAPAAAAAPAAEGGEAKPAPQDKKEGAARRRSSFKVGGDEFPTEIASLADKRFANVEEYAAYLKKAAEGSKQ